MKPIPFSQDKMARAKILIVEDDRDIVEMVEYNLKDQNYEVISALDGNDGLASAMFSLSRIR